MHIRVEAGKAVLSMRSYVETMLKELSVTGVAASPATGKLFECDDTPLLKSDRMKKFHTTVAKLLYLAKRARPDILLAVAYLCTRVTCSTELDEAKLMRVLKYLNGTVGQDLILRAEDLKLVAYVDAAFGCHSDGKSHTGLVIMLGGANVLSKSSKQKIVTKDSTESELVGLSDMMMPVMQCADFLKDQGLRDIVPTIMQDNMSTITLVTKGGGKYRNKHLKVRQALIKERVDKSDIKIEYLPTAMMLADTLTKPLQGALFRRMTSGIVNSTKARTSQGCVEICNVRNSAAKKN
jgi:hypothetical protein